ncbi:hypothetical protein BDK51DRAFT_28862 [Blyttiomyces helicus]|uniref:Uncharacterized protein n=1 Tax=Blyttiomyces helicus TaxID=388810 RepID=A0A4P9WJ34_9FUNG|nr:hypothetical protein BDK51DRAFT_28862 [Blyttiomyces helicus]|eukprot:RKO92362.1 hypothetical protein BDK51DRAFT_28862 [Blyttiomyces helicus]
MALICDGSGNRLCCTFCTFLIKLLNSFQISAFRMVHTLPDFQLSFHSRNQMTGSKKLKEWKARINELDEENINAADQELKAILSEICSDQKPFLPIGKCGTQIQDIFSLDTSRVSKSSISWKLPEDVFNHEPSLWFES